VRRLPGAAWLAPAGGTTLRWPRAATVRVDGAAHDAAAPLVIGEGPVRVEVGWGAERVL
jgi:alpha-L-fucosidase 2